MELAGEKIVCGYGRKRVVQGVNISVRSGEVVAVIGHNGAGKSTLIKSLFGVLTLMSGRVTVDGKEVRDVTPKKLLRDGVAYVPQGNRVFRSMTVRENIEVIAASLARRTLRVRIDRIFDRFPVLGQKQSVRAGALSGGEKQMLALANSLILEPRIILVDEPSVGLAPNLATEAFNRLKDAAHSSNVGVLVIEQKVNAILSISDRAYVLRRGEVTFSGAACELGNPETLREFYL